MTRGASDGRSPNLRRLGRIGYHAYFSLAACSSSQVQGVVRLAVTARTAATSAAVTAGAALPHYERT